MKDFPKFLDGNIHFDERGSIKFVNEFDMEPVKRFYIIQNANNEVKRGWRGHKIEKRWFCALEGTFLIKLVKIENWERPDVDSPIAKFELSHSNSQVLYVPCGYATLISSLVQPSSLIVFADHDLEHAKMDDYLFSTDYFQEK